MLLAALALVGSATTVSATSSAVTVEPYGYALFYGTFDESPNTFLLAGGTVEEFCEAGPEGDVGETTARIRERRDGSTVVRVNTKNQPINLYSADVEGIPQWLGMVCPAFFAGEPAPQPFASGTARLTVRDRVFADDGTRFRVFGSADFEVVDGVPVGDPADFVDFSLRKIGR